MPDMTRLVVDGPVLWQRQILPASAKAALVNIDFNMFSPPLWLSYLFQRAAGAISFLRRGPTRQFGRESIDARSLLDSPKMIHNRVHFGRRFEPSARAGGFGSRCCNHGHHREKHASEISPTETERRRYVCRAPVRVSIVAVF